MSQCPECASFNENAAVFCSQCGASLLDERREARRKKSGGPKSRKPLFWLALTQILLLGAVIVFLMDPKEPDGASEDLVENEGRGEDDPVIVRIDRDAPDTGAAKSRTRKVEKDEGGTQPESTSKDAAAISSLLAKAVVIVELEDREGRRIRDTRGVLVHPDGVVLCRHYELAGAYRGGVRLGIDARERATIGGIIRHDVLADLALLRLDLVDADLPALSIVESPPGELFEEGDAIFVTSGQRARRAEVDVPSAIIDGDVSGMLLARSRGVVPEMFLAVEPREGSVVGLCRPVVDRRLVEGGAGGVRGQRYRLFVDPAFALVDVLEEPVAIDLGSNTREFFEGSFVDLVARGMTAYRNKQFDKAVELLSQAISRGQVEGVDPRQLEEVSKILRESFLGEITRLRKARRFAEAGELTATAIDSYPDDSVLWFYLGEIRLEQGLTKDAIGAFLEVRRIEGTNRVDEILEVSYRKLAAELLKANDARDAELVYIEGIDALPGSGPLRFELARLYLDWEALGDAARLLEEVAEIDSSLKQQAEVLLEKIDDLLARRDAVIIPISPESRSIRTSVTVDQSLTESFVIDTGATFTALSTDFAKRLGYSLKVGPTTMVTTAGGKRRVRVIKLASVSLGGYTVRNLEAYILPPEVGAGTNLLGLNFLKHFKFSVNAQRREFRLERL